MGLACFDIQTIKNAGAERNSLVTGKNFLENEYYKVVINANGDVSSIIDKKLNKELLSAPARMEFLKEHPEYWRFNCSYSIGYMA